MILCHKSVTVRVSAMLFLRVCRWFTGIILLPERDASIVHASLHFLHALTLLMDFAGWKARSVRVVESLYLRPVHLIPGPARAEPPREGCGQ